MAVGITPAAIFMKLRSIDISPNSHFPIIF